MGSLRKRFFRFFRLAEVLEFLYSIFQSISTWKIASSIGAVVGLMFTAWTYFWLLPAPIIALSGFAGFTLTLWTIIGIAKLRGGEGGHDKPFPVTLKTIYLLYGVSRNAETRRTHLKDIYNQLDVKSFPTKEDILAFCVLEYDDPAKTDFRYRFIVTDVDGNYISSSEWKDLSALAGYATHNCPGKLEGVSFTSPGIYSVCFELEQQKKVKMIGKTSLRVIRKQYVSG